MVSIIIVSFNTRELTRKCLESIGKFEDLENLEVIVVDNGSSDGSVEMVSQMINKSNDQQSNKATSKQKNIKNLIRKKLRNGTTSKRNIAITTILNNENLGFAKANNQGIKLAMVQGTTTEPAIDYVLLLNSDTEFKEKETIEKLVKAAENLPNVGAVVPRLLNTDGSVQESVFRLPTVWGAVKQYWLGRMREFGSYVPDNYSKFKVTPPSPPLSGGGLLRGVIEVESAVMAAMLIPRSTIEKIGLLDEGYHMYFEDLDYCRRMKQAGLKAYYAPEVEVVHHHGASGKKVAEDKDQWRRLIPGSKRYHGWLKHWVLHWVLWVGQRVLGRV